MPAQNRETAAHTRETEGTIQQVDAKYELLKRGQYVFNRSMYKPPRVDPKGPLQLGQAENAVEIGCVENGSQDDPLGSVLVLRDVGPRRELESRLLLLVVGELRPGISSTTLLGRLVLLTRPPRLKCA